MLQTITGTIHMHWKLAHIRFRITRINGVADFVTGGKALERIVKFHPPAIITKGVIHCGPDVLHIRIDKCCAIIE